MDTIDFDVMQRVANVIDRAVTHGAPIIHTVTIVLNGAHGGADVTYEGFTDETLDAEVKATEVVR